MKIYDTAIIGAGPAGIMSAIISSQLGKRVVLIDKNEQIGRKLLATGNGRCNISNKNVSSDNYYGAPSSFTMSVINRFNQADVVEFFENMGLVLKEEDNGRLFPRTNQASSVVEVLKDKLIENKVELSLGSTVKNIERNKSWKIDLENGDSIESEKLILATGGKAAHYLGSSGDGLFWAQKLGHSLSPILASLVPIETVEKWPKQIQGIKLEAKVSISGDGNEISQKYGDLLFTHFGLSGPAILSQSRIIAEHLICSKVIIHIDIFPDIEKEALDKKIANIMNANGKKAIKNCLIGLLPQNMIGLILDLADISSDKKAAELSKSDRQQISNILKDLQLTASKTRPLKEAQVTAGGIKSEEINPETMESIIVKDLYFVGEIVDVDGDSGGYNLQWSWSSGYVAGNR